MRPKVESMCSSQGRGIYVHDKMHGYGFKGGLCLTIWSVNKNQYLFSLAPFCDSMQELYDYLNFS